MSKINEATDTDLKVIERLQQLGKRERYCFSAQWVI